MILDLVEDAVVHGATRDAACAAVSLSARTVRRWKDSEGGEDRRAGPLQVPEHALSPVERAAIIETANSPEFRDLSPKQIVPRLADQGVYLASESSFYRVLHAEGLMVHREPSRPRTNKKPNAYVATAPGQVWTWDITYLRGPIRGTFLYLYLAVDIYSRKIVSAEVHVEETMELAASMVEWSCEREGVDPKQLVLHADNGGPMKGSTMLATLQRLGVVASFSRPHVSDDNPYVEALFRTLKFRPSYPRKQFESLEHARTWVTQFVAWYNGEHLHSAIRFVTPNDRHERRDKGLLARRRALYAKARRLTPRRWMRGIRNWNPVGAVLLNPAKAAIEPCVVP